MAAHRPRLFRLDRTLSGSVYAATGVVLLAVKYAIDGWIASTTHREWLPWNYFIWPGDRAVGISGLSTSDRRFALALLFVALPFIVVGVLLTAQRLRTVRLPVWLVALFFVPFVNFALFVVLVFAPDARSDAERAIAPPPAPDDYDAQADVILRRRSRFGRAAAIAWIVTVPATLLLLGLGVGVFAQYGWGLFVAIPFLQGVVSVTLFTARQERSWHDCFMVMLGALGLTAAALFLIAFEGILCLAMALPIAFVLAWLGAAVAYFVQRQRWSARRLSALCLTLGALAPAQMAAESASAPVPEVRAVVTSVVVAAPPDLVWRRVVSFPPMGRPREWLFAAGIAAPLSATIEGLRDGDGVGAVRHCVFTTGAFVEPIDVWDPPRRLHFAVTEQPPPMREWSPYAIHPPHLDGFLVSREGQFRIEPRADGTTLLEGTTWYTDRMWPAAYWNLWSDALIHAIHRRVLDHIRALAEADAAR